MMLYVHTQKLSFRKVGWGAWQMYKTYNHHIRDRGLHEKAPLVKVCKRLWFWRNLNQHVVSEVTMNLLY